MRRVHEPRRRRTLLVSLAALLLIAALLATWWYRGTPSVPPGAVAVVDGVEVSEQAWDIALVLTEVNDEMRRDTLDANGAGLPPPAVAFLREEERLAASWSAPVRAFGSLLGDYAVYAEAIEEGFAPTEQELRAELRSYRELHEEFRDAGDLAPGALRRYQAAIAHVGEERFWREIMPMERRIWLATADLLEARDASSEDMVAMEFEHAQSADVRLADALADELAVEDVRDYLRAMNDIVNDLSDAAQS